MTRLKFASAILGAAGAMAISTAAKADHGADDWADIAVDLYATGTLEEAVHFNSDRIKLQTKDSTTIRHLKLTFAPNAHTNWHYHPGITIVTVAAGTLSLEQEDCSTHSFESQESFVEADDDAHQATAGSAGATLLVTFIVPTTDPLTPATFRTDASPPPCA